MQLGIHVNTFRRPTLEETLDAVAELDLKCVHFNFLAAGLPSMPERIEEALCERIADALESRGIAIATLSATFNMIHPSVDVRRAGLRRLDAVASVAPRLGAPIVSLCTGTRDPDDLWRAHPDNDTPEAWDELVGMMAEALEIAERYDVALGVEPEVSNVIDSAVKARRLLDAMESPRLKIIIDGANLFRADDLPRMHEVLGEAFDLLGSDIAAAHAKGIDGDGRIGKVPPGKGVLDYDYYIGLLNKINFEGP